MNINIESISGKILLRNFVCSKDELVYVVNYNNTTVKI